MFNSILIACTGNICRSPMAAELLRKQFPARADAIISAGTHALTGQGADPLAIEVMREQGMDISGHRAQQLSSALLAQADLVLVMEQNHVRWVNDTYPQYQGKTYILGNWRAKIDVPDPYCQPKSEFEQCLQRLSTDIQDWLKYLE